MMPTGAATLSLPTFAAGVAAGFLVAIVLFMLTPVQTDKDRSRERTCGALVERIKLISSVIGAIEIISKVPAAAETVKRIGIDIAAMINGKGHDDTDSPLE
jgi:hypothetical protein